MWCGRNPSMQAIQELRLLESMHSLHAHLFTAPGAHHQLALGLGCRQLLHVSLVRAPPAAPSKHTRSYQGSEKSCSLLHPACVADLLVCNHLLPVTGLLYVKICCSCV
jgi:hypothetical protein